MKDKYNNKSQNGNSFSKDKLKDFEITKNSDDSELIENHFDFEQRRKNIKNLLDQGFAVIIDIDND